VLFVPPDFDHSKFIPKIHQNPFFSGPTGGAYSAPPDLLAGGEGAHCPSPRTPPPLSALQSLSFGPSGLTSSPHFLDRGYAYDFTCIREYRLY